MPSIVLSLIGALAAGCLYPSKRSDGSVEFSDTACFQDGKIHPRLFADLQFGRDRLSFVLIRGSDSVFYVRKDGSFQQTFWFDNGPDYFQNGLTRVVRGGKFGYMDSKLRIRIPPQWDFAYPFEGGVAEVGNRCTLHREDPEHTSMVCDSSWTIDTHGKKVDR